MIMNFKGYLEIISDPTYFQKLVEMCCFVNPEIINEYLGINRLNIKKLFITICYEPVTFSFNDTSYLVVLDHIERNNLNYALLLSENPEVDLNKIDVTNPGGILIRFF